MKTRTLKFIVEGQTLKPDPKCDFSNLIPGSENFIAVEFSFSKDWDEFIAKVLSCKSMLGKEYPPLYFVRDNPCIIIPSDILKHKAFRMRVLGKDKYGRKIQTNQVVVTQDGGNK